MADLIVEGASPPAEVQDDIAAIRQAVDADSMRVKQTPDSMWVIDIEGDNTEEQFRDKGRIIERAANATDDIRKVYERNTSDKWLIQLRY